MKFIKKHLGLILTLQSLTVIKLSVIFVIALSVYPCYSGESWYIYPDEDVPDIGQRHGMMQDSRGIIWFWGELGVVSYDGSRFRQFSQKDGLAHPYTYKVVEAADGSIIFCTVRGCWKYLAENDSIVSFHPFFNKKPIRDLVFYEDKAFLAWNGGVFLLRGKGVYSINLPNGEIFDNVAAFSLTIDRDHKKLWVASVERGIWSLDLDNLDEILEFKDEKLQTKYEQKGLEISHLTEKPAILDSLELFVISSKQDRFDYWDKITDWYDAQSLGNTWISREIFIAEDGTIYMFGPNGLFEINNEQLLPIQVGQELLSSSPINMFYYGNGKWLSQNNREVVIQDEKETRVYSVQSSRVDGRISTWLLDRQNILWVAIEHGTLAKHVSDGIKYYSSNDHSALKALTEMIKLDSGKIIIGGGEGVFCFDNEELTKFPIPISTSENELSLAPFDEDDFLISTTKKTVSYSLNNKSELLVKNSNPSITFPYARRDDGTLVFITNGKLYEWNGKKLSLHPFQTASFISPLSLMFGLNGELFAGSWIGLYRIKQDEVTLFHVSEALQAKSGTIDPLRDIQKYPELISPLSEFPVGFLQDYPQVQCGGIARDSTYWFGTFSSGIIQLDSDSLRVYDSRNGLPEDQYNSMKKGTDGTLYFIGNNSVVAVDREEPQQLSISFPRGIRLYDMEILDDGSYAFATSMGLRIISSSVDYSIDSELGVGEDRILRVEQLENGKLIAMQPNGIFSFDLNFPPDEVNQLIAPLFTGFSSGGKSIDHTQPIVLGPEVRSCQFEFTLPDFLNERHNMYSWKLEGLEDNWSVPSRAAEASYSRLPPGVYTFRLVCWNGVGRTTELSHPIRIKVLPHFFETALFRALVLILVALVIFLLLRVRLRLLAKRNHYLETVVQERTSDLESALDEVEKSRDAQVEAARLRTAQQMSGTIAHEFNNPLQVMQGSLELMKLKAARQDFASTPKNLDRLSRMVARMSELVEKLMKITVIRETHYQGDMNILDLHDSEEVEKPTDSDQTEKK
ncbi:hypothetical protein K8I28_10965 [bacterium]|nr:hypothetical protein [bacterium]